MLRTQFQVGQIVRLASGDLVRLSGPKDRFEIRAIICDPGKPGHFYQLKSLKDGHLRLLSDEEIEATD